MVFRVILLAVSTLLVGCTCKNDKKASTSIADEKPPDGLGIRGLVIDQPAEGAALSGAWTTVAGWVSPEWVQAVAVMGAPVDDFYQASGHVGVPSVPVLMRADGRFFAPRVPLQDGEVKIVLIPFGKGGSTYDAVTRSVTASNTGVGPATIVVEPGQPEPGARATLRATTGDGQTPSFQWDLEGDGTFEAEGASVTHTWAAPGRYTVVARTKVNDAWVSALAQVTVGTLPEVVASAPVGSVSRIFFLPNPAKQYAHLHDFPGYEDAGSRRQVDLVAVVDGDDVRVFDGQLVPQFVLSGFKAPGGVASDIEGNLYVADTGNDRLVRFTAKGELDVRFGSNGEFRGTAELPLTRPVSVGAGQVLLEDESMLHCRMKPPDLRCERAWSRADNDTMKKLGVKHVARMLPWNESRETYLADGKLLSIDRVWNRFLRTEGTVVDAVMGPDIIHDDYATVDGDGLVHLYRIGEHESAWKLPYAATAIACDLSGRIYVGGVGVVEIRAFEPLR